MDRMAGFRRLWQVSRSMSSEWSRNDTGSTSQGQWLFLCDSWRTDSVNDWRVFRV